MRDKNVIYTVECEGRPPQPRSNEWTVNSDAIIGVSFHIHVKLNNFNFHIILEILGRAGSGSARPLAAARARVPQAQALPRMLSSTEC